jgi:hypothetical protein
MARKSATVALLAMSASWGGVGAGSTRRRPLRDHLLNLVADRPTCKVHMLPARRSLQA